MGDILYTDSTADVDANDLCGFFEGWPDPPSPEVHLRLLEASDHAVLAVESETGSVVGFVRAVSDGVLSTYVSFLEVLPSHRGMGIGAELMRRMLEKLGGVYAVSLTCDPGLRPFYERFGMRPSGGYARETGCASRVRIRPTFACALSATAFTIGAAREEAWRWQTRRTRTSRALRRRSSPTCSPTRA